MKNQLSKKTIWKSTISFFILVLFIYLGLGSTSMYLILGVPMNTESFYDDQTGDYHQHFSGIIGEKGDTGWTQKITTKKDAYGFWEGPTTIKTSHSSDKQLGIRNIRESTETVSFEKGKRQGISITEYTSYEHKWSDNTQYNKVTTFDTICYFYGHVIPCDFSKSALVTDGNSSGFQILEKNYPWFLGTLNVLEFTNEDVQSYMDTIEVLLNIENFDISKFDGQYNKVIEKLEETTYDSLVQINSIVTSVFGLELMKDFEFRMAVIDQQREKDRGTFYFLQSGYPHFLTSFNSEDVIVKDSEWETFCSKFDSLMNTFSPVDTDDPFFVDSVDTRIYNTLTFISEEEEDTTKSAAIKFVLKQAISNKQGVSLSSLLEEQKTCLFLQPAEDITPQAFATAIIIRMAYRYLYEGEVPRLAIKEAYYLQQNIIQAPTLTTYVAVSQSSSSATIEGNVIKNGGAEIIDKGFVWATFLNPIIEDNNLKLPIQENFSATLDNLIEGETYYARSYATNTAGTAYGNNISFVAGNSVGLNQNKLENIDLNVYPNPTTGNLTIKYLVENDSECRIMVFDIHGKQVAQPLSEFQTAGIHQMEFDYQTLSDGIYFIKFTSNNQTFTVKSILNK